MPAAAGLALLGLRAAGPPGLQGGTGVLVNADGSVVDHRVAGPELSPLGREMSQAGEVPSAVCERSKTRLLPSLPEQQQSRIPRAVPSNPDSAGLQPLHTLLGPARAQLVGKDAARNSRITIPLSQREGLWRGKAGGSPGRADGAQPGDWGAGRVAAPSWYAANGVSVQGAAASPGGD